MGVGGWGGSCSLQGPTAGRKRRERKGSSLEVCLAHFCRLLPAPKVSSAFQNSATLLGMECSAVCTISHLNRHNPVTGCVSSWGMGEGEGTHDGILCIHSILPGCLLCNITSMHYFNIRVDFYMYTTTKSLIYSFIYSWKEH